MSTRKELHLDLTDLLKRRKPADDIDEDLKLEKELEFAFDHIECGEYVELAPEELTRGPEFERRRSA